MKDLTIKDMLIMSRELWEMNKDKWSPLEPVHARNHFLWMVGEIGEVLNIIKKCGEERIMSDVNVKAAFTEEMCDILMYFSDILMRYDINAEDITSAYVKKHNYNMNRDYETERIKFGDNL